MFSRARMAPVLAEFLGTGVLVMVALVLTETTAVSYFIATSVAVTLAVVYLLFGGVSGAHVNPAVTIGMWSARLMPTIQAVSYMAAQLLGGLGAWQLYQYLTDKALTVKELTFSTPMFVAEMVGAIVLTMAFAAVVTRGFEALQSAVIVGTSFFVGIMIAATASLAYLNPAIAAGGRAWDVATIVAPLVGGIIGVNLYTMLFAPNSTSGRRR